MSILSLPIAMDDLRHLSPLTDPSNRCLERADVRPVAGLWFVKLRQRASTLPDSGKGDRLCAVALPLPVKRDCLSAATARYSEDRHSFRTVADWHSEVPKPSAAVTGRRSEFSEPVPAVMKCHSENFGNHPVSFYSPSRNHPTQTNHNPMIRISRYFENQFDDREISDDELRAFAVDHLARLIAQNSAALYDAAIAATDTALTAFHGRVADESIAAAIRKSRTSATNALMDEIKGKWSRREGRLRDLFGVDSPVYVAFYPRGVTEYRAAGMEDMSKLLTRYSDLATEHAADLGQPFADEWTAYLMRWTAVRGAQVTQKGTATSAADQSTTTRTALELQLQANVLTVALHNIGQPERAALFFQQSLLENPAAAPAAAPTPPPALAPPARPQP